MPIILPGELPAARAVGSHAVTDRGAWPRALRVGLLNLMPDRIRAETQFAARLADTPHVVELVLLRLSGHEARHQADHVARFYAPVGPALRGNLDGLIVTGAPVEHLAFERVSYWRELASVVDVARSSVPRRLYICWSAQALLHLRYGIPKVGVPSKLTGVYPQRVTEPGSDLARGLPASFAIPVSRHTTTRGDDVRSAGLRLTAMSDETGPCLVEADEGRDVCSFNHFEYDRMALADEYRRDTAAGPGAVLPRHYFPQDDPGMPPGMTWEGAARTFFGNWLDTLARDRSPA